VKIWHRAATVMACLSLLPSLALAVATVTAPHNVSTEELQRFIYRNTYPNWCGAAGMAAREMRVKPSTDPSVMHGIMRANINDCANQTYAQQHPGLWNTAVFAASAAALIAARHEAPAAALRDATHAKNWSADIVAYTRQQNTYRQSGSPSPYRTDAGRINRDATTLIGAIQTAMANAPAAAPVADATPDVLPTHAALPGGATPHP